MSQPPLSLEQFDGHLPGHIKSLWPPPRPETDKRPGLKYTEAGRHRNDALLPVHLFSTRCSVRTPNNCGAFVYRIHTPGMMSKTQCLDSPFPYTSVYTHTRTVYAHEHASCIYFVVIYVPSLLLCFTRLHIPSVLCQVSPFLSSCLSLSLSCLSF